MSVYLNKFDFTRQREGGRKGRRERERERTQVSRSTQMQGSVSQPWLPIKITLSPNAPNQ